MQLLCLGVSCICDKGLLNWFKRIFEGISEVCMNEDYGD